MSDEVETMAYAGAVPWHGIGNPVSNKLSPQQMAKEAGINWTVSKREVFIKGKGDDWIEVKGEFALARDSDDQVLSMVGSTWKPVQNEESMEFFKKFVVAGHMSMETAGSLQGGRFVWALARINKDFVLGKDDEVRGFLLMSNPHVHGKSRLFQFTPIRVVCWNTLTWAVGADLKGKAGAFRMPHSQHWNDDMKKDAEKALGLASNQMEEFQKASLLLSSRRASEAKVEEFFNEVLRFDPNKAKRTKKSGEIVEPRILPKFREALNLAPGQDMNTALGTWWGALNAVTYVIDHEIGRDRSTALRTAWLGNKANVKRRAVDLAVKGAKDSKPITASVQKKKKAAAAAAAEPEVEAAE